MVHAKVIRHYLCGWFVFDVGSALPIDSIVQATTERPGAFRLLNVLKLLRLVRLQKLVRYFLRWNDDLGLVTSHSLLTQLMCLLFFVLLFIHIMACVEFLLPMLQCFPDRSWPVLLADANISHSCMVSDGREAHTQCPARHCCIQCPAPTETGRHGVLLLR